MTLEQVCGDLVDAVVVNDGHMVLESVCVRLAGPGGGAGVLDLTADGVGGQGPPPTTREDRRGVVLPAA
jgi:hypothetical protein